jgi:hypothetical protein
LLFSAPLLLPPHLQIPAADLTSLVLTPLTPQSPPLTAGGGRGPQGRGGAGSTEWVHELGPGCSGSWVVAEVAALVPPLRWQRGAAGVACGSWAAGELSRAYLLLLLLPTLHTLPGTWRRPLAVEEGHEAAAAAAV